MTAIDTMLYFRRFQKFQQPTIEYQDVGDQNQGYQWNLYDV